MFGIHKILDYYGKIVVGIGVIVGGVFGAIAIMIFLNVVLRYLGIPTISWVNEVAEYSLYVSAFLAAPWVLRLGLHIRIDILAKSLPRKLAFQVERLVDAIGLLICLTVAYYSAIAAFAAYQSGSQIYKNLIIPEWPVLAVIPVSFVMLSIEFILRLGMSQADFDSQEDSLGGF